MARVAVQLTNFTGGELSPRLDGRNDLGKYPTGLKTLENFVNAWYQPILEEMLIAAKEVLDD